MPLISEKPKLLCIGGHDVNMGAGLEMDYAVGSALGCDVFLCPTMHTYQSNSGLHSVDCIDKKDFEEDLQHKLLSDIRAIKIGALGNELIVESLIRALDDLNDKPPIIFDPVHSASLSFPGVYLNTASGVQLAEEELLSRVSLATPNTLEYGNGLAYKKCPAVLLKGGHDSGVVDYIADTFYLSGQRLFEVRHTLYQDVSLIHGTGCALSTAIASLIAKSSGLEDSVICALSIMQNWIFQALKENYVLIPKPIELDKKKLNSNAKKFSGEIFWI